MTIPSYLVYVFLYKDGWQAASDTNPACTADVDECASKPCSKNPEVACYNTPGSYTCDSCPAGNYNLLQFGTLIKSLCYTHILCLSLIANGLPLMTEFLLKS